MALFGKDRDRIDRDRIDRARGITTDGFVSPVTSAAPPEVEMIEREREGGSSGDVGGTSAFLGKGSRVTGKLVFEGTVRIEGHVEGEISAQDTLIIGESAEVNAQITGSSVVVHGRVTGDITARKRLEIRAPGKLFGNITTPSLVIHEGVVFEGQCTMSGADTLRTDRDRKVAFFPKEGDGAALKANSELGK